MCSIRYLLKLRTTLTILIVIGLAIGAAQYADAATITIPDDYTTIQEGVDAASPGDIVYVRAGMYPEHVTVSTSITLQGENRETTIICGQGTGNCVHITTNDVTVSGFALDSGSRGIFAENVSNIEITDCSAAHNEDDGFKFHYCTGSEIRDCDVTDTFDPEGTEGYGVHLWHSGDCLLENLRIFDNPGIRPLNIYWSDGTTIRDIELFSNVGPTIFGFGTYEIENLSVHDTDMGVFLNDADGCVLRNSVFTSVEERALSLIFYSTGNTLEGNIIANSVCGIALGSPGVQGNHFYHNRILNNDTQVSDHAPTHPGAEAQTWDDGYPSGGNYWSDYMGIDAFHGPNQDIPGPDGIGDTPHTVIVAPAQDNYPLMDSPCAVQDATWGKIKAMFM
jgi:nitrous oxidase accessory protein NosD